MPAPTAPAGDLDAEPPPAGWTPASQAAQPQASGVGGTTPESADAFGSVEELVRNHVQQARAHFSAGRYDQAISELESAYKLRPNSNYLFSIAQSHRRAGRNRKALAQYERFLAADPDSPLKTETLNYISELKILIQQEDVLEKELRRPLWRKGWFWGVVASSTAVVGVALGVGLGLGLRNDVPTLSFGFGASNALTNSP